MLSTTNAPAGDRVHSPGAHAALPSLLTLCGLLCGVAGVLLWPHPWAASLLLASVALDALDGRAARALGASTGCGARLDRAADTAVAYGLAWRVAPAGWDVAAVVGLALVAATGAPLRWLGGRIPSGRLALTVVALAWRELGGAS